MHIVTALQKSPFYPEKLYGPDRIGGIRIFGGVVCKN